MRAFILFLILTLCAFALQAESMRFGALGRNDTVVTKESDPIASAAIASETSARQSAVTDLTNKINAESAARTQAFSSVEAQLEALSTKKQDALVTFKDLVNTGDVALDGLDNMSDVSWFKGSLADAGIQDDVVAPHAISFYRRANATTNGATARYLRLLRWDGSAWYVAYQAATPIIHNDVIINGGEIFHQMEHVAGSERIPTDETIVLCYAPAKSSPVTAVLNFGAKVIAANAGHIATGQSSTPASPTESAGWNQLLAMKVTVKEYKNAIATLASRVEAVAASAESAQRVAESASATASAAVASADSAKASASTASNAADGARVIAQSAVSTAQSARATAENAMAKASAVEKTANAAATASDVAVLSDRVTALEGRPSGDASGLSERVAKVESSISTVSETATAASASAASASTVAESAKTTATAASATAESAKASAATAQALAVSAAAAAEKAQSTASEASTTASAAMAKASSVEKTANAAATAASVATLSDRVTSLENRPSGGVSDADLAAETSARKAADADLSARIESVANNAAGKASVATLQTQLSSLQSDVSDNATAISAAQKTADAATASAASAISTANIATDTANAASATANVATVTADEARTTANSAVATVSEIEGRMSSVYSIAEEARSAVNSVTDLAAQAAAEATKAASAAHNVTNDIKGLYDRDQVLADAINGKAETKWFSFANNYAHLGFPGVTNYRSEIFIQDYGLTSAYALIRVGEGLKHVSSTGSDGLLDRRIAVDIDALGVNDTTWVHRKDWTLKVYPGEMMTTVASSSSTAQNELGQVRFTATVTRTESLSKGVETVWVDDSMGSSTAKTVATWTASDGASVNALSNSSVAHVSATAAGLYTVSATDSNGVVREVFVPFSVTEKTEKTEAYVSDAEGTYRKLANDAMLGYLQSRDTATKTIVGITAEVASDDRAWYWSGNYNNYVFAGSYMPRSALVFCNHDDEFGPPAVAVAPHYAITAAHWNPGASRLFWYFPRISGTSKLSMVGEDGIALAAWARENGYSEEEIQAANISDIFVYRMHENGTTDGPFPDANIPHILDQSALDYYYNGSIEGVSCYTVTQDRFISHAAYSSARGDRWCGFGVNYEPRHVRADIRALLSPSHCSKIYGGDSGRPILFLHNGDTPVLTSIFWTAGSGSSLIGGCEILDAYIKQHSGGTESLKRISAPTE